MSTNPVHIDRLEAGVMALMRASNPTAFCAWQPSGFPLSDQGALILTGKTISGPGSVGANESDLRRMMPTEITLTVGSVAVGNSLILYLSGRRYVYDVTGTDSEVARDGLLALLDPFYTDAVAVASGLTDIVITATAVGDLYALEVAGPLTADVTSTLCAVQFDMVRADVEIQAYSSDPLVGAGEAISRLRGRLRLPQAKSILTDFALTVQPGRPTNLDSMSGPEWESRCALSLEVTQASVAAEAINAIVSVGVTVTTDHGTLTVESIP